MSSSAGGGGAGAAGASSLASVRASAAADEQLQGKAARRHRLINMLASRRKDMTGLTDGMNNLLGGAR